MTDVVRCVIAGCLAVSIVRALGLQGIGSVICAFAVGIGVAVLEDWVT